MVDVVARGAEISDDGRYRYNLYRAWEANGRQFPAVLFVMLNPSTADADVDDPTIRRCMSFAQREGHGAMWVVNLYPQRTHKPKYLLPEPEVIAVKNINTIRTLASACRDVVVAWGSDPGPSVGRWQTLVAVLQHRDLMCLGTTQSGHPRHPLYLRGDTALTPWHPDGVQSAQKRSKGH